MTTQKVKKVKLNKTERAFIQHFKTLQREVHDNAKAKGWWDERDAAMSLLNEAGLTDFGKNLVISQCKALEHSEISEGLEGLRGNLMDDKCPEFPMAVVEDADVIIRMMDKAERFGWPLVEAIVAKMAMNRTRSHKHGGKAF